MKTSKAKDMVHAAVIRRFLMFCAVAVAAGAAPLAQAAATAQGVALNAAASCSNASLDITLTTIGAASEFGRSTNLAGATLDVVGPQAVVPALATFSGTFAGWNLLVNPAQPADTLIGAYVHIGEAVPTPADTAEFFVFYNCSTKQVLLACYGPYGTCPKTAQEAAAQLAVPRIPTLADGPLALTILLLTVAGGVAVRRRQRQSQSVS